MKNYAEILRAIGGYFDEAAQREISCAEVAEYIEKLEAELAELRKQQTFAWNALDSAMSKDHNREGSLADAVFELAVERDALRQRSNELETTIKSHNIPVKTFAGGQAHYALGGQQQGEPVAWLWRWKGNAWNACVEKPGFHHSNIDELEGPIPLYREAAPRVPEPKE